MSVRERLNEALKDRYRIEREVGRGGMAIVFRARDLRHGRDVALKVLLPEIAEVVGPDRFLREVELAAGLTHPVILPVFDSGRASDLLYYVMPFIEGEALADRIKQHGPLPVEEALRIGREVADGLDHAHARGVVHRDVKPGNILLSGDHAWIADFGIAVPIGPKAGAQLTRTGLAIGTPAYMSPEQASGEREIDGRSDIYSLGCVLYEALSGQQPFEGPTPQSILVRRLTTDPEPIRSIRKDVVPRVERALERAMARRPEDRFQSAAQFRDALAPTGGLVPNVRSLGRSLRYRARNYLARHPVLAPVLAMAFVAALGTLLWVSDFGRQTRVPVSGGGEAPGKTPSVAVAVLLPRTPGESESLRGYEEGLTVELNRRLGAVEGLETRSLRAVLPFASTTTPPDSIGRALSVDYIVESTLLGSADTLRLNLSLVEATTGNPIAEIRQEARRGQILPLLDSVTREVAFSLRQELGREFRVRELQAETEDEQAWLLVSRAETERRQAVDAAALGDENRDRAVRLIGRSDSLLEAAMTRDSEWSEPYVQHGWNRLELALVEGEEAREYGPEDRELVRDAVEAADEALRRDSLNADAFALRGTALYALAELEDEPQTDEDLQLEAKRWLERAIALDPEQVRALSGLADIVRMEGNPERALELLERAYEADRWLADAQTLISRISEFATDLEEYDLAWERAVEGRRRWPDNLDFPGLQLLIVGSTGTDVETAWAVADTVAQMYSMDRESVYRLLLEAQVASVIARAGLEDSARSVLESTELRATRDEVQDLVAYYLAYAWLVYGDTTRALDWLAIDLEADPAAKSYRAAEPWFRPLHGNPRFEALVSGP